MGAGEPILAQKVLIVGDEEETTRSAMDLGVCSISPESSLSGSRGISDPTKACQALETLGHRNLDIVVQQDERGLLRLSGLPPWQRLRDPYLLS